MKARIIAALALALPLTLTAYQAAAVEAGFDYKELASVQPKETKAKVEVIEFFSYRCPHCFQLEPSLREWIAKQSKDVKVIRQPVIFSDKWEPTARAYFALDAMGLAEKMQLKVFEAIHQQSFNFDDSAVFFEWAGKQGVDVAKLRDAYNSFNTGSRVARAKLLARNYKLDGVPALAVNGKYLTSASMTGTYPGLFAALDELVRIESGGKAKKPGK